MKHPKNQKRGENGGEKSFLLSVIFFFFFFLGGGSPEGQTTARRNNPKSVEIWHLEHQPWNSQSWKKVWVGGNLSSKENWIVLRPISKLWNYLEPLCRVREEAELFKLRERMWSCEALPHRAFLRCVGVLLVPRGNRFRENVDLIWSRKYGIVALDETQDAQFVSNLFFFPWEGRRKIVANNWFFFLFFGIFCWFSNLTSQFGNKPAIFLCTKFIYCLLLNTLARHQCKNFTPLYKNTLQYNDLWK